MVENSRDTVLVLLKAEEDELSLNASDGLVDGNQLIRDILKWECTGFQKKLSRERPNVLL
jgi:hypothetical protein